MIYEPSIKQKVDVVKLTLQYTAVDWMTDREGMGGEGGIVT